MTSVSGTLHTKDDFLRLGLPNTPPSAPFNRTIGDGTKTTSILPFVTACADLSTLRDLTMLYPTHSHHGKLLRLQDATEGGVGASRQRVRSFDSSKLDTWMQYVPACAASDTPYCWPTSCIPQSVPRPFSDRQGTKGPGLRHLCVITQGAIVHKSNSSIIVVCLVPGASSWTIS